MENGQGTNSLGPELSINITLNGIEGIKRILKFIFAFLTET